jgi:hypothetical protein
MRVEILGFGSIWRRRLGKDPDDPRRFARAAYYNTTGVTVGGKLRTRPRIVGHARFNGVGGFNPNNPARMIGRVFDCEEPCVWQGQNKLLFRTLLRCGAKADRYLVAVKAREVGRLMVGLPGWSSDDVWVIALSECADEQEALLLMAAHGWVRTSVGKYTLKPEGCEPPQARLQLTLAEET